jgi:hypothetical protein
MKKLVLVLASLFLAFFFVPKAQAASTHIPQITTLSQNQIVNKDYFAAGEVVEVYGTVNGDAYIAGGQIKVEGTINGDLLVVGGQIKVTGKVTGNIRAAGGQIDLTGATVGKNITLAGGDLESAETTKVGGSFTAAGGNINLYSPIGKGVNLAGGNVSLNGIVLGDTQVASEVVRVTPKASLAGTFDYWSQNEPIIDSQAVIKGVKTKHELPVNITPEQNRAFQDGARNGLARATNGIKFFSFLSFLVVGLVMAKLFPEFSVKVSQYINKFPWPSLGWGALISIFTPVALVFVMVTIIGIPLAGMGFLIYFLFSYIGKYFAILTVGEMLLLKFKQKHTIYFAFVAGLVVYYILALIPIVNMISRLGFYLIGFGGLVKVLYGSKKNLNH